MTALGIVLVVLGAALLVAEAHLVTAGALGALGIAALAAGAAFGIGSAGLVAALAAAVVVAAAGTGALLVLLRKAGAVRRVRARTGAEGLIGHVGVVRRWEATSGQVLVDGALWRAIDAGPDEPLAAGDAVVVEHVGGLTLGVRRADEWELMR
jgi:membrane-bound serine protease (ClpP class)